MFNKRIRNWFAIFAVLMLVTGVALVGAQEDTEQPYVGITFQAADEGVEVMRVLRNSPADDAGLQPGDIITAVNGEAVDSETLADTISAMSVGDEITLDVLRDDEPVELSLTLAAQPERPNPALPGRSDRGDRPAVPNMRFDMQRPFLGVTLEATDDGVAIAEVVDDSPAAEAGLQEGDVIESVSDVAVETPEDVVNAIADLAIGDEVSLTVNRDGEAQAITATLGSMRDQMPALMQDIIIYDGDNWQIVNLSEDSALAQAGLQAGDVITAVDGESYDPAALNDYLSSLEDDAEVTVSVDRADESLDITVSAADLASLNSLGFGMGRGFEFRGPRGQFNIMPGGVWLGVQFQNLDADVAAENDLNVTEGALITEVIADSPAAEAGLQVNDVIIAVSGDPVDAGRTLRERLLAYAPGDVVTLDVLRDGDSLSIDVTLGETDFQGMMEDLPFEFNGMMPRFFGPDGRFQIEPPQAPAEPIAPAANL